MVLLVRLLIKLNSKNKAIAVFEVEAVENDISMKAKKRDNQIVTPNREQEYFVLQKDVNKGRNTSTNAGKNPEYPLIIGRLSLPRTNIKTTEIIWPNQLKLQPGNQIIAVRIHAPGFPSSGPGPYFRLLLSSAGKSVVNDTVELVYDSAKGFLLRQLVTNACLYQ